MRRHDTPCACVCLAALLATGSLSLSPAWADLKQGSQSPGPRDQQQVAVNDSANSCGLVKQGGQPTGSRYQQQWAVIVGINYQHLSGAEAAEVLLLAAKVESPKRTTAMAVTS